MKTRKYNITKNYKSIYHYLKDNQFAENYITNLRKVFGYIKINDKPTNINASLKAGDVLEINSDPSPKSSIMHCIIPLDIVYEDEYYLLINKPAGLPCMPSRSHYNYNLAGAICHYMDTKDPDFTLRIINRLDKDTAGIIIVAKDSIAQKDLKEIKKQYYAICEGCISSQTIINKNIKTINENGKNDLQRVIAEDGKPATTCVYPIKFNKHYSLIKLELVHGRTHQIRLHLSSINHPLLGDNIYGSLSTLINHTALICKNVSFFHPYLNKLLSFEIPFPNDFKDCLTKLF